MAVETFASGSQYPSRAGPTPTRYPRSWRAVPVVSAFRERSLPPFLRELQHSCVPATRSPNEHSSLLKRAVTALSDTGLIAARDSVAGRAAAMHAEIQNHAATFSWPMQSTAIQPKVGRFSYRAKRALLALVQGLQRWACRSLTLRRRWPPGVPATSGHGPRPPVRCSSQSAGEPRAALPGLFPPAMARGELFFDSTWGTNGESSEL